MGTTPLMKTIVILLACVAADKFELDMPRQGSRAPELCSEFISNPAAKTFIWATHRELMDYAETTPGLEVEVKLEDYDLLVRGLAASYATAFGNMTHDDPTARWVTPGQLASRGVLVASEPAPRVPWVCRAIPRAVRRLVSGRRRPLRPIVHVA